MRKDNRVSKTQDFFQPLLKALCGAGTGPLPAPRSHQELSSLGF